jgi:hypothetical protein
VERCIPGENGAPTYRNRYVGREPGFKAPDASTTGGVGQSFYPRARWSSRECSRGTQDTPASNWPSLATGLMSGMR